MAIQKQNIFRGPADDNITSLKTAKHPISLTRFPVCWRTPNDGLVWAPLIEMYSHNNKFIVHVELPGVNKEDLHIALVGNDLIIKGERKTETTIKKKDYYCSEMSQGQFFRSVSIPVEVKKAQIKATYSNGILEIELHRDTSGKSSQVNIKVN